MNVLVIVAHPNPGSFNHAIAETAVRTLEESGHQVVFHDLYREGFDPILIDREISRDASLDGAIEAHCGELAGAEGVVIVHPNWWGQPPAVLKGWIDRIFRPGVAYEFLEGDSGEGIPVGLLKARAAVVLNTSNTPRGRELQAFGDPLEALWKSCIFDLCGVKRFYRKMYGVIVTSTPEQRREWLDEVRAIVRNHFPSAGC